MAAVPSHIWAESCPGGDCGSSFGRKISGKDILPYVSGVRLGAANRTTSLEAGMNEPLQYQVRLKLDERSAELAREDAGNSLLAPLMDILRRHGATLVNQLDAFEGYVAQAEKEGVEAFPLYRWTKAVIEDPDKRKKHLRSFTLHVSGHEIYAKEIADPLEAALQPLVGGGLITALSKHDTNPENNPQMPAEYRA
jgi:hypothetical protein